MRRRLTAALALAGVLLLAGCTGIPTSGAVNTPGPRQDVRNQDVVLVPYPPAANAAPTDIVQGFITAATGQQNGYATARKFLTPDLAKRWRPDAQVLIHDQSWQVKQLSDTSIVVTVPTTARVNADGVYTSYSAAKDVPVHFGLVKVNGQWRISSTPNGIILGTNYFGSLFTARPVYFFDPSWNATVPDLRWFPASTFKPKDVVAALLDGASAPIATPVTTTAFPASTRVTSVHVSSGVAEVDLDTGNVVPSNGVLRRMREQLDDSLKDLKTIQQVQVSINGTPVPVPTLASPQSQPDPRPLVLRDGTVGFLSGSKLQDVPAIGPAIAAVHPVGGTVAASRNLAALRTRDAVVVVTSGHAFTADRRPGLVDPTLDPKGYVYSVPGGDPTAWRVTDTRGRSSSMTVAMPGIAAVTAIEASRDGTRMLVLAQTPAQTPTAFVAGIVRDPSGAPVALTTERYLVDVPVSTQAVDATWEDANGSSVAVLTQDDTGDSVAVQQLGGLPGAAGRLSNAESIVGASQLSDLRALLQNGAIGELSGSVWQPVEPAGSATVLFVQR